MCRTLTSGITRDEEGWITRIRSVPVAGSGRDENRKIEDEERSIIAARSKEG